MGMHLYSLCSALFMQFSQILQREEHAAAFFLKAYYTLSLFIHTSLYIRWPLPSFKKAGLKIFPFETFMHSRKILICLFHICFRSPSCFKCTPPKPTKLTLLANSLLKSPILEWTELWLRWTTQPQLTQPVWRQLFLLKCKQNKYHAVIIRYFVFGYIAPESHVWPVMRYFWMLSNHNDSIVPRLKCILLGLMIRLLSQLCCISRPALLCC